MTNKEKLIFQRTVINIFITVAISSIVLLSRQADYLWLSNNLGEMSVTEMMQLLMLTITTISFFRIISVQSVKSAAILVSGFFTVLIIRESDHFLDFVTHGFWVFPALFITFSSIFLAASHGCILSHFTRLLYVPSMQVLICSTVLLLVFSRVYGMDSFWMAVMDGAYIRDVKNISEETIELLFYSLIAFSAFKTSSNMKERT